MSDEAVPEEDAPPWWWHTEHKKGCKAWKLDAGSRDCTCDYLRACEQRMRDEQRT